MNGIIIVNQYIGHNEYKINRFLEEFPKLNINLSVFKNDGTLAKIIDSKIVVDLPKCDFVIYLDKDIYLARLLEKAGFRLFNRADFIKMCDDKMLTFVTCANLGIRMPKTFAGPLVYTELDEKNYAFLNKVVDEIGFPMVVKKVYGSLGEGVYLVNDFSELKDLYSKIYRNPILFQEYIPSSFGTSIRVMIVDQEVKGAFVRYNKYDFRSNFGEQADSKPLEDTKKCYAFADKIAKLLQIEYAGLDFLIDKNNTPILCEINSNAFFEEYEKVTKQNIALEVAKMIKKNIGQDE